MAGSGANLVLGAPTLARALLANGKDCWLIDRQPSYGSFPAERHFRFDLRYDDPAFCGLDLFETVFVDPPWYPLDIAAWLAQASRHVLPRGSIHISVWPRNVRPSAESELKEVLSVAGSLGDTRLEENALCYKTPCFEIAAAASLGNSVGAAWRHGSLLSIRVKPDAAAFKLQNLPRGRVWHRFVLDCHQVALCWPRDGSARPPSLRRVGHSWILPDVSRRNPLRTEVDLWSSDNRIAGIEGASAFLEALEAIADGTDQLLAGQSRKAAELLSGHAFIPRGPYKRASQWHHLE